MDYLGTDNDDTIDQATLSIADGSVIYGRAGNDTIIFGNANVLGEVGNDTFTARNANGAVVYWNSPAGVRVDLTLGIADDGFGTRDTLNNVRSVHGSGFNDMLIGSGENDQFAPLGGNNTVIANGGIDTVSYFFEKSSNVNITYDPSLDRFTVVKNFANDKGTDILTGVEYIAFTGPGSDELRLTKNNFVAVDGFLRNKTNLPFSLPEQGFIAQIKPGDFNGDGIADFVIQSQIHNGLDNAPLMFFVGDGKGAFQDQTALIAGAGANVDGTGRALVADFNKDGVSDFFVINSGDDRPPYLGGKNLLFLSSSATHRLETSDQPLTQSTAFHHGGVAGDVNGDGHIDLLINGLLSAGNSLFFNDGKGIFSLRNERIPHPVNPKTMQPLTNTQSGLVDVNNDGKLDLILGTWDNADTYPFSQVLLNDGNGDFTKFSPIDLPKSPVPFEIVLDIQALDLNGDALPDLMLSYSNGNQESYYLTAYIQLLVNQGNGKFADETLSRLPNAIQDNFGKGWFMSLASVDFNHDGFQDILATGSGGDLSSVVLMNDGVGHFTRGWSSPVGGRSIAMDIDGDGMSDIVTSLHREVVTDLNMMVNAHIYRSYLGSTEVTGSEGNDSMFGGSENNIFRGRGGDDVIHGGDGIDVAMFSNARASYSVNRTENGFEVRDTTGKEGVDTVTGVERLQFADTHLALDIDGIAGQAYRIYKAAFARSPDLPGLGFWIAQMDGGVALANVADGFVHSAEYRTLYSDVTSNASLVERYYINILGRAPEKAGLDFWAAVLDNNNATVAQVLAAISESAENVAGTAQIIGNGFPYTPFG